MLDEEVGWQLGKLGQGATGAVSVMAEVGNMSRSNINMETGMKRRQREMGKRCICPISDLYLYLPEW